MKFIMRAGTAVAVVAAFAAFAPLANAEDTTFEVSVKDHQFQPAEFKAAAGAAIVFKVKNLSTSPVEFESEPLQFETVVKPNATFHGPSRNFSTRAPHAVNDLTSPASYTSREDEERQVTSKLVLFLRSGAVQTSMPHHLIGPNGMLSAAKGPTAGVSTGIGGTFRFVKLTEGFHE